MEVGTTPTWPQQPVEVLAPRRGRRRKKYQPKSSTQAQLCRDSRTRQARLGRCAQNNQGQRAQADQEWDAQATAHGPRSEAARPAMKTLIVVVRLLLVFR